jgi:hypothetical protein
VIKTKTKKAKERKTKNQKEEKKKRNKEEKESVTTAVNAEATLCYYKCCRVISVRLD